MSRIAHYISLLILLTTAACGGSAVDPRPNASEPTIVAGSTSPAGFPGAGSASEAGEGPSSPQGGAGGSGGAIEVSPGGASPEAGQGGTSADGGVGGSTEAGNGSSEAGSGGEAGNGPVLGTAKDFILAYYSYAYGFWVTPGAKGTEPVGMISLSFDCSRIDPAARTESGDPVNQVPVQVFQPPDPPATESGPDSVDPSIEYALTRTDDGTPYRAGILFSRLPDLLCGQSVSVRPGVPLWIRWRGFVGPVLLASQNVSLRIRILEI